MINYYLLTKPGIILGNLFTFAAGFLLASRNGFHPGLFFATLCGLALIIASACVFNNYIDRALDRKMKRTQNRPLVTGLISGKNAVLFALCLGVVGCAILIFFANWLSFAAAITGFFIYVLLYSFWKSHTIYATAIGSIAGALPPVVGYLAAGGTFDLGALILLLVLILWQMPHFFAIALWHLEEYSRAGIPVLPVKKGAFKTKVHMTLYVMSFICAMSLLTFFNYSGFFYLTVMLICCAAWLSLCFNGFWSSNDKLWAKRMFQCSLIVIGAFCLTAPL